MGVAVLDPFTAPPRVAVPSETCWLFVLSKDRGLATGSEMIKGSRASLQVCFAPTLLVFDSTTLWFKAWA